MILNLEERIAAAGGHLSAREAWRAGWLTSELIATERGVDRLREWARAGCPVAEPADVRLMGSGENARESVLAALSRIPPPVLCSRTSFANDLRLDMAPSPG